MLHGLYAITDDTLLPGDQLLPAVRDALAGGASLVQYRAKQNDHARRRHDALALLELCKSYQVPLIINDDVQLCLDIGADGVHLGQQDTNLASARARLGSHALLGASCHASVALGLSAQKQGADYVAFGRLFPSHTKPAAPSAQLSVLTEAKETLRIPIVAIGGINAENGAAAIAAGADMLAVIHYLFGSPAVKTRARQLASLFATAPQK